MARIDPWVRLLDTTPRIGQSPLPTCGVCARPQPLIVAQRITRSPTGAISQIATERGIGHSSDGQLSAYVHAQRHFEYDGAARLTREVTERLEGVTDVRLACDLVGNRIQRKVTTEAGVETTSYVYHAADRLCDDAVDLCDVDHLQSSREWALLGKALPQIVSQAELGVLLTEADALNGESAMGNFILRLPLQYGIQGCISLWMPPRALISHLSLQECESLLDFRVKVAVLACSLPQVERLLTETAASMHDAETPFPVRLRERMVAALRQRLDPHSELIAFRF